MIKLQGFEVRVPVVLLLMLHQSKLKVKFSQRGENIIENQKK